MVTFGSGGEDDDRAVVDGYLHARPEGDLLVRGPLRPEVGAVGEAHAVEDVVAQERALDDLGLAAAVGLEPDQLGPQQDVDLGDRKSTRLNSSHGYISYAVFCLKKKKKQIYKEQSCC